MRDPDPHQQLRASWLAARTHIWLWRLAATGLVLALAILGYQAIGFNVDPAESRDLATPLDLAIPLVPWTVVLYSWVYTTMLYPLFTVRCDRLFGRVVGAYTLVLAVSLACYALVPVTTLPIRPPLASLDEGALFGWALRFTYEFDPPYNAFPSLHLSVATLAALTAHRARPAYGWLAAPVVLGIALTIFTTRQHYLADGLAGLALGAAAYWLIVRPHRRQGAPAPGQTTPAGREPFPASAATALGRALAWLPACPSGATGCAYGWRGPLLYLLFHGLVYLAFSCAFLSGWVYRR